MRIGLAMLALFALLWVGAGLLAAGCHPAWLAAPAAVSAVLLWQAWREPAGRSLGPHVGRLVARWSMAEGVAIFVAINLLATLHRADLAFPAVAAIVGLHFLPLARGIPLPLYHLTAAALVLVAVAGLALPPAARPLGVGLGGAAVLWATIAARVLATRRGRPLVRR